MGVLSEKGRFSSREDVDTLTDEEALEVVSAAKNLLIDNLRAYPHGLALDDGGDYLAAAIENYHDLFNLYWQNDGQNPQFLNGVKRWLKQYPGDWGGSDGEVRNELFTDEYVEGELEPGSN